MEPSTETEPNKEPLPVHELLRKMGITDEDDDDDERTYGYATQILNSCALPKVLNVIIKTGALEIILKETGKDGLSPREIASRIEATNREAPDMLDRMLRMLATYNVVSCRAVPQKSDHGTVERRYGPSPVTKCFVPDERMAVSYAPMVKLITDPLYLASWSKLKEAVLEGGVPFDKVHGMNTFEYARVDKRFNETFNMAMYDQSSYVIWRILNKYRGFKNVQELVEVGGGYGHVIRVIAAFYPGKKYINFDLPHVIERSPSIPCVDQIGGDMFESVPNGDAILMKGILHCWSDERCVTLLKNCYRALPEDGGKVIVVETNIADEPEMTPYARATSLLDVSMMTQCPGGKERTRREFEALANAAGFAGVKGQCCVSNLWVMEFYK